MRSRSHTLILGLSAASALAYLLVPPPLSILCKGLSITLLACIAFASAHRLLALALLLSSCGDILLACGNAYFLGGLALFLCAHLVYLALFLRCRGALRTPALLVFLLLYGLVFGAWLAPSLGPLRVPVFCYIAAILAMAAAASQAAYPTRWVLLGALLFLVSDSLLGAGRFKSPLPLGGVLVWTTYYAAQCAIALGVLAEPHPVLRS